MGLLSDIIDGATDGSRPVSQLLRSVQVLAIRGGARDLSEWVIKERDGYGVGDPLPDYRGPFDVQVRGQLTGPFGSNIANVPIPRASFPEQFAPLFRTKFRGPVVELEDLLRSDITTLGTPWSGDAIGWTNNLINDGKLTLVEMHYLQTARTIVPRALVLNAVEAVRNRLLDLALELEQVAPDLDRPQTPVAKHREHISAVYQTIVHSGANAYIGTNQVQHPHAQVVPGDADSLRRFLDGIRGLADADKQELVEAATDAQAHGQTSVDDDGRLKKTLKKVGSVAGKAGQEAINVAVKAALQHWLGPGA